jgi:hypothetical protein
MAAACEGGPSPNTLLKFEASEGEFLPPPQPPEGEAGAGRGARARETAWW